MTARSGLLLRYRPNHPRSSPLSSQIAQKSATPAPTCSDLVAIAPTALHVHPRARRFVAIWSAAGMTTPQ
jgi:hypothetical protein